MVRRAPPESRVVRSWPHFWPEDAAIDPSPRNRSHYNSDRCRPAAPAHHSCTHISRRKDGDGELSEKASGFRVTFMFACVFPSCVKYDGNVFSEKISYAKTRGLGGSALMLDLQSAADLGRCRSAEQSSKTSASSINRSTR